MPVQIVLLAFTALSLLMLTALQAQRVRQGGALSSNFAKLFGVIVIAGLGCAIALSSDVPAGTRTAAFTLLGTLAGYLAGAKPSSTATGRRSRSGGGRGGRGDTTPSAPDSGEDERRQRGTRSGARRLDAENQL